MPFFKLLDLFLRSNLRRSEGLTTENIIKHHKTSLEMNFNENVVKLIYLRLFYFYSKEGYPVLALYNFLVKKYSIALQSYKT